MVLNIVIARKGTGFEPIECQPITRVIECPKGSDVELIAEEAIDELAAEHGIFDHLWCASTPIRWKDWSMVLKGISTGMSAVDALPNTFEFSPPWLSLF